ncbi:hypothetical protein M2440_002782 [Methylorubrum extorquens]|nr:hypothetical protein [Methylorubrum extorquens]
MPQVGWLRCDSAITSPSPEAASTVRWRSISGVGATISEW